MLDLLTSVVSVRREEREIHTYLSSAPGGVFTTNAKSAHLVEMSAMSDMLLSHLHVGAAHIADNALCSIHAHMNRPMSPQLQQVLASDIAKAASDGVSIFVRGSAVGAVGGDEVLDNLDFLLDFLLDLLFLDFDVVLFGLDFLGLRTRLALDGNVGAFDLRFLFDWHRGRETWWHLWVGEQVLKRLSVNFVGHAVGWKKCKFRALLTRKWGEMQLALLSEDLPCNLSALSEARKGYAQRLGDLWFAKLMYVDWPSNVLNVTEAIMCTLRLLLIRPPSLRSKLYPKS